MLHPPLYKAEEVFDEEQCLRTVECICGKNVQLEGKDVVYTHKLGSGRYGWFCVCTFGCFLTNVRIGGRQ